MAGAVVPVFGTADNFYRMLPRMALKFTSRENCSLPQVCKAWKEYIEAGLVALHKTARFGVEGNKYSYKSWVVLNVTRGPCHPKDLCVKYHGEPVGEDPVATLQQIEELAKDDPETYQTVYIYPSVKRPIRETEVATVDKKGRLTITEQKEPSALKAKDIEVRLSIHNAIKLFEYPLTGKENDPVFFDVMKEVFEQCHDYPTAPRIKFIKRKIPDESLNLEWEEQAKRFRAADLLRLILHKGFEKLETGTMNFEYDSGCVLLETFVRTSDTILTFDNDPWPDEVEFDEVEGKPIVNADQFQLVLVWHIDETMWISFDKGNENYGVIPCISAETQEDTLEPPLKKCRIEKRE